MNLGTFVEWIHGAQHSQPMYRCGHCSFQSLWQQSVEAHNTQRHPGQAPLLYIVPQDNQTATQSIQSTTSPTVYQYASPPVIGQVNSMSSGNTNPHGSNFLSYVTNAANSTNSNSVSLINVMEEPLILNNSLAGSRNVSLIYDTAELPTQQNAIFQQSDNNRTTGTRTICTVYTETSQAACEPPPYFSDGSTNPSSHPNINNLSLLQSLQYGTLIARNSEPSLTDQQHGELVLLGHETQPTMTESEERDIVSLQQAETRHFPLNSCTIPVLNAPNLEQDLLTLLLSSTQGVGKCEVAISESSTTANETEKLIDTPILLSVNFNNSTSLQSATNYEAPSNSLPNSLGVGSVSEKIIATNELPVAMGSQKFTNMNRVKQAVADNRIHVCYPLQPCSELSQFIVNQETGRQVGVLPTGLSQSIYHLASGIPESTDNAKCVARSNISTESQKFVAGINTAQNACNTELCANNMVIPQQTDGNSIITNASKGDICILNTFEVENIAASVGQQNESEKLVDILQTKGADITQIRNLHTSEQKPAGYLSCDSCISLTEKNASFDLPTTLDMKLADRHTTVEHPLDTSVIDIQNVIEPKDTKGLTRMPNADSIVLDDNSRDVFVKKTSPEDRDMRKETSSKRDLSLKTTPETKDRNKDFAMVFKKDMMTDEKFSDDLQAVSKEQETVNWKNENRNLYCRDSGKVLLQNFGKDGHELPNETELTFLSNTCTSFEDILLAADSHSGEIISTSQHFQAAIDVSIRSEELSSEVLNTQADANLPVQKSTVFFDPENSFLDKQPGEIMCEDRQQSPDDAEKKLQCQSTRNLGRQMLPRPSTELKLVKVFYCKYQDCGYSSRHKSRITSHVSSHIGYQPFQCSSCSFTSSYRIAIWQHCNKSAPPHEKIEFGYTYKREESMEKQVAELFTSSKQQNISELAFAAKFEKNFAEKKSYAKRSGNYKKSNRFHTVLKCNSNTACERQSTACTKQQEKQETKNHKTAHKHLSSLAFQISDKLIKGTDTLSFEKSAGKKVGKVTRICKEKKCVSCISSAQSPSGNKPHFYCKSCGERFDFLKGLSSHLNKKHKDLDICEITMCRKDIPDSSLFDEIPPTCQFRREKAVIGTPKLLSTKREIKLLSVKRTRYGKIRKLVCKPCNLGYSSVFWYERHLKIKHPDFNTEKSQTRLMSRSSHYEMPLLKVQKTCTTEKTRTSSNFSDIETTVCNCHMTLRSQKSVIRKRHFLNDGNTIKKIAKSCETLPKKQLKIFKHGRFIRKSNKSNDMPPNCMNEPQKKKQFRNVDVHKDYIDIETPIDTTTFEQKRELLQKQIIFFRTKESSAKHNTTFLTRKKHIDDQSDNEDNAKQSFHSIVSKTDIKNIDSCCRMKKIKVISDDNKCNKGEVESEDIGIHNGALVMMAHVANKDKGNEPSSVHSQDSGHSHVPSKDPCIRWKRNEKKQIIYNISGHRMKSRNRRSSSDHINTVVSRETCCQKVLEDSPTINKDTLTAELLYDKQKRQTGKDVGLEQGQITHENDKCLITGSLANDKDSDFLAQSSDWFHQLGPVLLPLSPDHITILTDSTHTSRTLCSSNSMCSLTVPPARIPEQNLDVICDIVNQPFAISLNDNGVAVHSATENMFQQTNKENFSPGQKIVEATISTPKQKEDGFICMVDPLSKQQECTSSINMYSLPQVDACSSELVDSQTNSVKMECSTQSEKNVLHHGMQESCKFTSNKTNITDTSVRFTSANSPFRESQNSEVIRSKVNPFSKLSQVKTVEVTNNYIEKLHQVNPNITNKWEIADSSSFKRDVDSDKQIASEGTVCSHMYASEGDILVQTQCPAVSSTCRNSMPNQDSPIPIHDDKIPNCMSGQTLIVRHMEEPVIENVEKQDDLQTSPQNHFEEQMSDHVNLSENGDPNLRVDTGLRELNCMHTSVDAGVDKNLISIPRYSVFHPKQYICPFPSCHKNSVSRSRLRRHLFIHYKYYPYKCAYCSHRTRQPNNLKLHLKRTHSHLPVKYTYEKEDDIELQVNLILTGKPTNLPYVCKESSTWHTKQGRPAATFTASNGTNSVREVRKTVGSNGLELKECNTESFNQLSEGVRSEKCQNKPRRVKGCAFQNLQKKHKHKKNTLFQCAYCSKVCTRLHYLKQHYLFKHPDFIDLGIKATSDTHKKHCASSKQAGHHEMRKIVKPGISLLRPCSLVNVNGSSSCDDVMSAHTISTDICVEPIINAEKGAHEKQLKKADSANDMSHNVLNRDESMGQDSSMTSDVDNAISCINISASQSPVVTKQPGYFISNKRKFHPNPDRSSVSSSDNIYQQTPECKRARKESGGGKVLASCKRKSKNKARCKRNQNTRTPSSNYKSLHSRGNKSCDGIKENSFVLEMGNTSKNYSCQTGRKSVLMTPTSPNDIYFKIKVNCPFSECGYTSNYRMVKGHLYSHFDYHPYLCGHCSFSCSRMSAIKKHMHLKHPENHSIYSVKSDKKTENKMANLFRELLQEAKERQKFNDQSLSEMEKSSDFSAGKTTEGFAQSPCWTNPGVAADVDVSLVESEHLLMHDKEWLELEDSERDVADKKVPMFDNMPLHPSPNVYKRRKSAKATCLLATDTLVKNFEQRKNLNNTAIAIHENSFPSSDSSSEQTFVQDRRHKATKRHPEVGYQLVRKKNQFRYKCTYCGLKFFWRCRLRKHHVDHHPGMNVVILTYDECNISGGTNIYECKSCVYNTFVISRMKKHIIKHHAQATLCDKPKKRKTVQAVQKDLEHSSLENEDVLTKSSPFLEEQDLENGLFFCKVCNFKSCFNNGVKIHCGRKHPEMIFYYANQVARQCQDVSVSLTDFLQMDIEKFQMTVAEAGVSNVNIDILSPQQFEEFLDRCLQNNEVEVKKHTLRKNYQCSSRIEDVEISRKDVLVKDDKTCGILEKFDESIQ